MSFYFVFFLICFFLAIIGLTNPIKAENGSSQAANLPRKGTFTDDLHQLVDDFARDAMSHAQVKKNSKQNLQSLDVSSINHRSCLLAIIRFPLILSIG